MSTWLVRHANMEITDDGNALLIRSLLFGAGGLEHSNRNVLFIPSFWVANGLPESMPIIYQQDQPTHFSAIYRSRVRAALAEDDPGSLRARLAGLVGLFPGEGPKNPLPMRVTDEDDSAPLARLGIPDQGALGELTVCGASLEIALARGSEVRLEKSALAFALPVLLGAGRLVELVRSGINPASEFDRRLLQQIDYVDASGARVALGQ